MVDTRFRAMPGAPLPVAYTTAGMSSLMDLGRGQALPGSGGLGAEEPTRARRQVADLTQQAPHGTTVVAVTFNSGALIVGDRRAISGGPDLARGIYPNIITITAAECAVHLPEDKVAEVTESVVTARDNQPRG